MIGVRAERVGAVRAWRHVFRSGRCALAASTRTPRSTNAWATHKRNAVARTLRPGGTRSQARAPARPLRAGVMYVGHGSGVPASVPGAPRRSVGRRPRPRPGGTRSPHAPPSRFAHALCRGTAPAGPRPCRGHPAVRFAAARARAAPRRAAQALCM